MPDLRKLPEKLRLAYRCLRAPYFKWVPPGHYYSPLPDMDELERRSESIYPLAPPRTLPGLDLRAEQQNHLLMEFEGYYGHLPFERSCNSNSRFYRPNGSFPFQDAFILSAMVQRFRPSRIVEAGCGFSSCVILDTCEALRFSPQLTFIDPYPDLLLSLVRPEDRDRLTLRASCVQDVPRDLFSGLEENDILFIDTSHVSKAGSDVNFILFEILPRLKAGVIVHFHDIWYPFEYPKAWLYKGMFWNEAYLLRAFLSFNSTFEILMFNSFSNHCLTERIRSCFPLFLEDPGASLWLRRVE
jgi:Methyltransferase domain